jgi:hypothetical protein
MISDIKPQYTAEYIAKVLETREIAKVSSITLIPEIKNNEVCNIAYVDIDSYCDTESAYEFILNIKSGFLILCNEPEENPWIIQENTHNSGGLCVGTYTTKFYNKVQQEEQDLPADEISLNIDYYSFYNDEHESRIQHALNNSYNVTLRPHQQNFQLFRYERSLSDLTV